jgi:hypothetical protein
MTREERRCYLKTWRAKNRDRCAAYRKSSEFKKADRNRHLIRKYGITYEDEQRMWDAQKGLCLVCHKPLPPITDRDCQVDHCHKTNQVRGLLHWYCNMMVGLVENHPVLHEDVIQYLSDAIVRTHENTNHEKLAEMSNSTYCALVTD